MSEQSVVEQLIALEQRAASAFWRIQAVYDSLSNDNASAILGVIETVEIAKTCLDKVTHRFGMYRIALERNPNVLDKETYIFGVRIKAMDFVEELLNDAESQFKKLTGEEPHLNEYHQKLYNS